MHAHDGQHTALPASLPAFLPDHASPAERMLATSEALRALRTADDEPALHAATDRFLASARAAIPIERILVLIKEALHARGDRRRRDVVERDRRVVSRAIEAYYATSYDEPPAGSVERALDIRPVRVGEVGVDRV